MCEPPRVDDDPVEAPAAGLDAVDDGALMVGLEGFEGGAEGGGVGFGGGFDFGERGASVDVWLASAEEVEVWTVDEEDGVAHGE